jgi:ABC-type branched-subunit amino acid transport system substrate-binding protein
LTRFFIVVSIVDNEFQQEGCRMKSILLSGVFVLGLSVAAYGQEAVIGAILPLSGSSATQGDDQRRGMELALEKINADGGVLGHPLKIITEDSGGRTATALDAAKKLVTVDKIPVVLGEFSSGITIPGRAIPSAAGSGAYQYRQLQHPDPQPGQGRFQRHRA